MYNFCSKMNMFCNFVCCIIYLIIAEASGANFETTPPFHGEKYGENIPSPRGLLLDDAGDILVVSAGSTSSIFAITETPIGNGSSIVSRTLIVNAEDLGLTHGITYIQGYIYASSASNVYRWPYVPGQQTIIEAPPQTVVHNIPTGGHSTRTLKIGSQGRLYVSCGSDQNVDPTSIRAKIRTFSLVNIPNGGWDFSYGLIFADGVRNQVAIGFDLNGILWGVDNGAAQLNRPDLGEGVGDRNPGEELNKFNETNLGRFYGYPYCFSSYDIPGYPPGTQFVWPSFMDQYTDEWCRNPANNKVPIMVLKAHDAPLGIHFYDGRGCNESVGAFPCSATGDAFISFHGSAPGYTPTGYRVVWLSFNKTTGDPTGEVINVIYEPNVPTCGGECFRPVNVVFNNNGHLIVSTDVSNEMFRVTYDPSLH